MTVVFIIAAALSASGAAAAGITHNWPALIWAGNNLLWEAAAWLFYTAARVANER